MEKRQKALFVINTLGQAGAEIALLELLGQLCTYGLELSVYVLTGQGELAGELPAGVRLLNCSYCEESVLSKKGQRELQKKVVRASLTRASLLKNLPYLVGNGLEMIKKKRVQADKLLWRVMSDGAELSREEYDLAVAYLEGGAAYYVADHVKAKKKAAFVHIDYRKAGYTRALDRDCYLKFDRIFPVSEEVKSHFLEAYPECADRTMVFHNMLNVERIRKLSLEGEGFTDGFKGFRILTVGRLVEQKGYDIAVRVMRLLKETGQAVRWYVIGEGPLRRQLERQIAQFDLTGDFVLAGAKKNPYPYFVQADLYANLSLFEGKSIAIQEAQILGIPVIASDANGNREQITDRVDGCLCRPEPEEIRDEILRLMEDEKLRNEYAERARRRQTSDRDQIERLLELLK